MFLEQVTLWQRKLGTVDVVLNTWSDVQRKWQALESIFIGLADIRVQLPADSARFDALNVEFKARSLTAQFSRFAVRSVHNQVPARLHDTAHKQYNVVCSAARQCASMSGAMAGTWASLSPQLLPFRVITPTTSAAHRR